MQWLEAIKVINAYGDTHENTTGTIVAILDLGVDYRHPDLANQMRNGINCVNEDGSPRGNCIHGASFYVRNIHYSGSSLYGSTTGTKNPLPESNSVDVTNS